MDNLVVGAVILFIILMFWMCFYNPPHAERMKVGAPYGYYTKEAQKTPLKGGQHENMVSQIDWADMSRGLNIPNSSGYTPVIRMLNEMEKAQGRDIETDNRQIDSDMW